jgi:hypothetical protein
LISTRTKRTCIICLLASFIAGITQSASGFGISISNSSKNTSKQDPRTTSNRPWGNIGTFKPGIQYEPPPAMPAQQAAFAQAAPYGQSAPFAQSGPYPGSAPGTGWYAGQMPAIGNTATGGDPRVEVETARSVIYEQQNVIYTVRVVSDGNLKTLDPVVPDVEGAILEQLDGPIASTRLKSRSGGQEIVNTYHFKLTPLRSGEISVPPIRFTGTPMANRQWNRGRGAQPASSGKAFSIASEGPLTLEALAADPSVTPWLPLHDLQLRSHLSKNTPAKEGVPVTLTLELKARGATGEQLPSLEGLLKSDQFRAYRDSTTTSSGISRDGKYLNGSRKETYTLIPLQDGWIRLPAVSVAWWDVDSDAPRTASLPGTAAEPLTSAGSRSAREGRDPLFSGIFWAPIFITLGLIAGYWLGAFARTRPVLRNAARRLRAGLNSATQQLTRTGRSVAARLSLAGPVRRLRLGFALMMPKSIRLWMCTRCIEREDSPEAWCAEFKSRACQHLGIATHTPLPVIAERIIEMNPKVEPGRVRALAQSLDSAMYGGQQLDFVVWKREFQQHLRPHLFRSRRSRNRRSRGVLPALNPRSA